jgi:hypothetical protein
MYQQQSNSEDENIADNGNVDNRAQQLVDIQPNGDHFMNASFMFAGNPSHVPFPYANQLLTSEPFMNMEPIDGFADLADINFDDNTEDGIPQTTSGRKRGATSSSNGGLKTNTTRAQIDQIMSSITTDANRDSSDNKNTNKDAQSKLTSEEKKALNRDRNREHARSTRMRKKAYVNKLKELVEGLQIQRSEEDKKRRVAVQHLAEVHNVRKKVVKTFLRYHSINETEVRNWNTILEDNFYFKQPVTPFRYFRRSEIENERERECRISYGTEAMMCDSSSLSVMIESVGCQSARWIHIKREEFLGQDDSKIGMLTHQMPRNIDGQNGHMQHAISSLSSSSRSSTDIGSSEEEERRQKLLSMQTETVADPGKKETSNRRNNPKQVSSSSTGSGSSSSNQVQETPSEYFHDYHAQPLPDPYLDSGEGSTGSDSPSESMKESGISTNVKQVCTDSSSGDDENPPRNINKKRRLMSTPPTVAIMSQRDGQTLTSNVSNEEGKIIPAINCVSASDAGSSKVQPKRTSLPPNLSLSGGIVHNVRPNPNQDINPRLRNAPATQLPPFVGLGKLASKTAQVGVVKLDERKSEVNPNNQFSNLAPSEKDNKPQTEASHIVADNSSSNSDYSSSVQILANYHVNEDDMLITDDVLMCPFIFRTQDAVLCGALAECVMPGMLRAQFSDRNKLLSVEMVYDAMGFMQQLERASGSENEGIYHIVPNSLEMALQPCLDQARIITTAKAPFRIVSVNSRLFQIAKYSQVEIEGKELSILEGLHKNDGKIEYNLNDVAKGRSACSVNLYYDKEGDPFIAYVTSTPLTNQKDCVSHILHTFIALTEPGSLTFTDGDSTP